MQYTVKMNYVMMQVEGETAVSSAMRCPWQQPRRPPRFVPQRQHADSFCLLPFSFVYLRNSRRGDLKPSNFRMPLSNLQKGGEL